MSTDLIALSEPRRGLGRRSSIARLARYGATSVVAFAVSEITLLALYGSHTTSATAAAALANLAGTVPSYLMSRYWIWSEASRTRVGRQIAMYWTISIVCIAGTSLATGAVAAMAPSGRPLRLAVVGVGFLLVNVVFWLAKFVVYQGTVFPVDALGANASDRSM
jgi:putative flippase GtrA